MDKERDKCYLTFDDTIGCKHVLYVCYHLDYKVIFVFRSIFLIYISLATTISTAIKFASANSRKTIIHLCNA